MVADGWVARISFSTLCETALLPPMTKIALASSRLSSLAVSLESDLGSVSKIGALRCPAREEAASASGKSVPDATTAALDGGAERNAALDTIPIVSYLVLPEILVIDVAAALAVRLVPANVTEAMKMHDNAAAIFLSE